MERLVFVETYDPPASGKDRAHTRAVMQDMVSELRAYRELTTTRTDPSVQEKYADWLNKICSQCTSFSEAFFVVLSHVMDRCMSPNGTLLMLQVGDMEIIHYANNVIRKYFSAVTTGDDEGQH